jgi:hypothetical protein
MSCSSLGQGLRSECDLDGVCGRGFCIIRGLSGQSGVHVIGGFDFYGVAAPISQLNLSSAIRYLISCFGTH